MAAVPRGQDADRLAGVEYPVVVVSCYAPSRADVVSVVLRIHRAK
jgi:hypothetical protein